MSNYCNYLGRLCEYSNQYGSCTITACTKVHEVVTENTGQYFTLPLSYSKSIEEEYEEQQNAFRAESYLKSLGIKVKTDMYDYYRNTYDILIDLGKYLSKNNKI